MPAKMLQDYDPYARLAELGLSLSVRKMRADWFAPTMRSGDLLFTSGQVSIDENGPVARGRLGAEVGVDEGQASARVAMLNVLSLVHQSTGDLRLWRPFKIVVYGATTPEFEQLSEVVNGASLLLVDVFGPEYGTHSRTGVSMVAPAHGAAVEVEAIFQLRAPHGEL